MSSSKNHIHLVWRQLLCLWSTTFIATSFHCDHPFTEVLPHDHHYSHTFHISWKASVPEFYAWKNFICTVLFQKCSIVTQWRI